MRRYGPRHLRGRWHVCNLALLPHAVLPASEVDDELEAVARVDSAPSPGRCPRAPMVWLHYTHPDYVTPPNMRKRF